MPLQEKITGVVTQWQRNVRQAQETSGALSLIAQGSYAQESGRRFAQVALATPLAESRQGDVGATAVRSGK
jgi:hypothetical protein